MLDRGEADDKIIAIMHGDPVFGEIRELSEVPEAIRNRLRHYFATYKLAPGEENQVIVGPAYGRDHAEKVILAAMSDYRRQFSSHATDRAKG
jgi:inorganic pyrophosphatase